MRLQRLDNAGGSSGQPAQTGFDTSGGAIAVGAIAVAVVAYASLGMSPVVALNLLHHGSGLDIVMTFGQFTGLGHVLTYGLMTWVAFGRAGSWHTRLAWLGAIGCLGVGLELAQQLTVVRQFDLVDMAANGAGIALAVAVWAVAGRRPVADRTAAS